jgi:plastocyanin
MTVVVLVAACAGGGDGDPAASRCVPAEEVAADIGAPAGSPAIALATVDDRFDPRCVAIAEPGPATLVVRNDGRHSHNLTVDDARRVSVDAGQVAILEVDVTATGLHYVCTIHPGMEGDVQVRG